jgi:flagellar biosynthesis GTPase FlhF
MFFQTGSVIGRSFTQDGDQNPGKVPIQEITSGSGGNKMQALIGNYNYYLQMIRDVTGLNEARDGSMPDKNALVGVQKLAAANSNIATRHILQAGLFLTAETCECLSLRISDILEYSPSKDAFMQSIGGHNLATLEELSNLYLYDFGIFLELAPDEEEKALLENNIQIAIKQGGIDLEDAIDVREIRNVKLANQVLKIRRKKKQEKDQLIQQQNIQAQSQANAQAQQVAAQAEVQKNQALTQSQAQLEQIKSNLKSRQMELEVQHKMKLMQFEFEINQQLQKMNMKEVDMKETMKEDRKDQRVKMQASQQSELIDQRNNNKPPKNFESSGNDILGGGFDLGRFEPS